METIELLGEAMDFLDDLGFRLHNSYWLHPAKWGICERGACGRIKELRRRYSFLMEVRRIVRKEEK